MNRIVSKDVMAEAQSKGGAKFEVCFFFVFPVFWLYFIFADYLVKAVFQADWAVLPGEKKAKKHKFKVLCFFFFFSPSQLVFQCYSSDSRGA